MSRTRCPHCNNPLLAYVNLQKYDPLAPSKYKGKGGVGGPKSKVNKEKMLEMFEQGFHAGAIGNAFGVSECYIRELFAKHKTHPRKARR